MTLVMDADTVLRGLLDVSAVTDLVGGRIYADIMPATSYFPLLTYRLAVGEPERSLRGASRVDLLRYELDGWALSREEVVALGDAVRDALDGQVPSTGMTQYAFGLERHQIAWDEAFQFFHLTQEYAVQREMSEAPA
jgi:hypothetical protein